MATCGCETTCQRSESDRLRLVVLHEPDVDVVLSMAHPAGALFEQEFSYDTSVKDHKSFQTALEERGCKVLLLRDILEHCDTQEKREILEEGAMDALKYEWIHENEETEKLQYYVSDEYKRKVIKAASNRQLVNYLFLQPTVHLAPEPKNTGVVTDSISCLPMGNLVFTRDQQITTNCGIVMGRMSNHQRAAETTVLRTAWKILSCSPVEIPKYVNSKGSEKKETIKIQVKLAGELPYPYTLEGGDFLQQMNMSLCGAGYRSVEGSHLYLMRNGLLCNCESGKIRPKGPKGNETDEVGPYYHGIVRDGFDHNQERIHLDCILAFLNECTAVIDETVLTGRRKRYVDVYQCDHKTPASPYTGSFKMIQAQVSLDKFLSEQGIKLIPINHENQLAYGVNVLSCGNGMILSVCKDASDSVNKAVDADEKLRDKIHSNFVEYRGVTSMYGSVHCSSQAIYREMPEVTCEYPFIHIEPKQTEFDCVMGVASNLDTDDIFHTDNCETDNKENKMNEDLVDLQDELIEEEYKLFESLTENDIRVRFELHSFFTSYKNTLPGKNIVSLKDKTFVTATNEPLACFAYNYLQECKKHELIKVSDEVASKCLKHSTYVMGDKIMCNEEDATILKTIFGESGVQALPKEDNDNYTVIGQTVVYEEDAELPPLVASLQRRICVSLKLHRRILGVGIRDILAGI